MKKLLIAIGLALTTISAQAAGFYLDLGVAYVDQFSITESISISNEQFTTVYEGTATIDVDSVVPMLRFGYDWNSFVIEYDTIGVSEQSIQRVNIFYRIGF